MYLDKGLHIGSQDFLLLSCFNILLYYTEEMCSYTDLIQHEIIRVRICIRIHIRISIRMIGVCVLSKKSTYLFTV